MPAPASNTLGSSLLDMRGIVRRFGAVAANDGIDLRVEAGQIIGLLGENGSGKSTLMKVLFGMQPADAGSIMFKGRELSGHRPREAMAAGIAMIHQHFMLVEALSVLDNVMLGWAASGRLLRRRAIASRISEASARFGLDLDPGARVGDLPLGRRQRVEILKAILRGADLLVLDEPTSNLAPAEIAGLLGVLRQLRAAGAGIVFITHKLPEVLALCDAVVVLRAGRVVARQAVAGASAASLAAAMIEGVLPRASAIRAGDPRASQPGAVRLSVSGLRGPGLGTVDFELRAGEVLGVAGVDGNGQIELVETLAGLRSLRAGRILLDGRDLGRATVSARIRAGLAYCPADRAHTSLVPAMSIAENLALRRAPRAGASAVTALMRDFEIRAPGPSTKLARLSGGNQQKVAVARELDRHPAVLIAHQPAWGLDPHATAFVLGRVAALAAAGGAVLYVSSELEEVLAVSDRVAVLFGGRFAGVVGREAVDPGQLGLWMSGGRAA